jgi:hypothetical protein
MEIKEYNKEITVDRFSASDARVMYNRIFFPLSCKSKRSRITSITLLCLFAENYKQALNDLQRAFNEDFSYMDGEPNKMAG